MPANQIMPKLIFPFVLIFVVVLIWFVAFEPIANWKQNALSERARTVARIADLQSSIASLKAHKQQLSQKGRLTSLWKAEQTGAATALIQSQLTNLASARGISLRAITPVRPRAIPLAKTVGFRIELEAGLDQMALFLRDLEYHSPVFMIDRSNLRRLNTVNADRVQPVIFAQIELSAPISLQEEAE